MRLEWRQPHYRSGHGDGEVWHLHGLDFVRWRILGSITYLGLTRHGMWADRLQRWRIDRDCDTPPEGQEIRVKTMEEAKATALAILTLS